MQRFLRRSFETGKVYIIKICRRRERGRNKSRRLQYRPSTRGTMASATVGKPWKIAADDFRKKRNALPEIDDGNLSHQRFSRCDGRHILWIVDGASERRSPHWLTKTTPSQSRASQSLENFKISLRLGNLIVSPAFKSFGLFVRSSFTNHSAI